MLESFNVESFTNVANSVKYSATVPKTSLFCSAVLFPVCLMASASSDTASSTFSVVN